MSDDARPPSHTLPAEGDRGSIVALTRDLFFGMRVRTVLKQLGYGLVLVKDESAAVAQLTETAPVLVLVDFNQPVDWPALGPMTASDIPVIAFGSHTDVDGFRVAKAAGVDRVVSNGEFSRALPDLIDKYRRP